MKWWLVRHRARVVIHRIRFPGVPMFTDAAAQELVGRRVVLVITNRSEDGHLLESEQHDCRIVRANTQEGVVLETHDGAVLTMPADLRPYFGARTREYRFKSNGHVAIDPDLETTWTRTEWS